MSRIYMFHGSMVALATPMRKGAVDIEALRRLVEFHIEAGTHAVIPAGTTGESGTLSHDEKLLVIRETVAQAAERIQVIAGTAANATEDCIELTRAAMECGVHAALIMTPAYIKPTQEGLYLHYSHIAGKVPIPIILYNVPGRTGCDLLPETVGRLAKISNIIGIKEATGQMSRVQQILELVDSQMDVYSGDDPSALHAMMFGAKGVISVTANVVPKEMAKLCDMALDRNYEAGLEINKRISRLHELLFIESNPIPVKWALYKMGLCENEIRLPLTALELPHQKLLEEELKILDLL